MLLDQPNFGQPPPGPLWKGKGGGAELSIWDRKTAQKTHEKSVWSQNRKTAITWHPPHLKMVGGDQLYFRVCVFWRVGYKIFLTLKYNKLEDFWSYGKEVNSKFL